MTRLFGAMKRIWHATKNITSSVFAKATEGTSETVKVAVGTIALAVGAVLFVVLLVTILLVSIPWGIYARVKKGDAEHAPEDGPVVAPAS